MGFLRLRAIGDYAATGVDIVSLGWLTHSVTGLDMERVGAISEPV